MFAEVTLFKTRPPPPVAASKSVHFQRGLQELDHLWSLIQGFNNGLADRRTDLWIDRQIHAVRACQKFWIGHGRLIGLAQRL